MQYMFLSQYCAKFEKTFQNCINQNNNMCCFQASCNHHHLSQCWGCYILFGKIGERNAILLHAGRAIRKHWASLTHYAPIQDNNSFFLVLFFWAGKATTKKTPKARVKNFFANTESYFEYYNFLQPFLILYIHIKNK